MPKKTVLNKIWPFTSSYSAVYPSISFSSFRKNESATDFSLLNNQFLLLVFLDTYGASQFPIIKGFCNISGNTINISYNGISYSYQRDFYTIPIGAFGFKLIDDKEHQLFFPWSIIKDGYCEFGFLINPNYVTLNGIPF